MSYAILITGQSQEANRLNQILVVSHDNNTHAWSRSTDGGRGERNAWTEAIYAELLTSNNYDNFIVGEVLSSPLTSNDIEDIEKNERPNVLIQKLTKQFGLRHEQVDTTRTIADVLKEVDVLISQDPTLLSKYRSDGRSDKSVTAVKNPVVVADVIEVTQAPIAHTEKRVEVSASASNDVIGNYVIRVPSKELVGNYIERTLAGGIKESKMYQTAKKLKKFVLIEGHAGTGKTTSGLNFGLKENQGVYVFSCSMGVEVGQFIGKTVIDSETGKPVWIDGVLTQAVKRGDIVILDEVDFAPTKILQRLQDLLQNRTLSIIENGGEVVTAHPDFMVIATYNNGYRGSNKLNEAFVDRFGIKLKFEYDNAIEKQVVKSSTLLKLADQMRADSIQGLYTTPISLRWLLNLQELSQELGYEFAVENALMNFTDDERGSVRLLFDAHRTQLEAELINN
jgi:nitric oxide reductase NorQ protein